MVVVIVIVVVDGDVLLHCIGWILSLVKVVGSSAYDASGGNVYLC